jgi:DNA ligase (NAD+)
MAVFFSALGISGAGKEVGRILATEYGNFDKIRNLSIEELTAIDGIGPITSKSIVDYFQNNKEDMDALLSCVELELPKQGSLSGKNFCFTGGFPNGKEYWQNLVEKQGGKIQSSVSKKTHFCIVGQDAGSKEKRAEELGITKLELNELKKILGV